MLGMSKLVIAVVTASMLSGGALVVLTASSGGAGNDYGLDTDGNGLFDWLVVKMPFTAEEANYYSVIALLGTEQPWGRGCFSMWTMPGPLPQDPNVPPPVPGIREGEPYPGPVMYPISFAIVREFLEPGDHTFLLSFKGTDIGYAGVDGPYEVQAYVFADGGTPDPRMGPGIFPYPGDWTTWEYTTSAYASTDFEEPTYAIRFTGAWSDEGLDTDGDGLYDYLVLTAPADVNLAGPYYFGATLMIDSGDPYWGPTWVTSTYGTVELAEGQQTIEARLNGGEIWASGHSGSFDFMMDVYYGGWWYGGDIEPNGTIPQPGGYPGGYPMPMGDYDLYGDFLCGATSEYANEDWEELVEAARFTGVFADRGEDYDADGLFDVLAVDAEIEVTQATYLELGGTLMSSDGTTWITMGWQSTYLDVGTYTVTLYYDGPSIRASGVDGPYVSDMVLWTGYRGSQATYTTGAYAATDFDEGGWGGNGTRGTHWISDLQADASTISVSVQRGNDLLTYVITDTLTVQAYAEDGTLVFEAQAGVSLPSGGDSQSFTFSWAPDPGTYVVMAYLGDASQPNDAVRIVVTV